MHMRSALAIISLALAAAPATADADRRATAPWATVNVCDTLTRPNQMGIRGSMPGMKRKSRMYMRFRVQFQDTEGVWHTLRSGRLSDSRWRRIATGRRGEYDSGWSFEFKPPVSGGAHVLRGLVLFQWRRGHGEVVKSARAITEAGHPGTAGAEPPEFSAATCEIA
jgi:hypothetical protein